MKDNFASKQVLSNQYIVPLNNVATYGAPKEEEGNKFYDFDMQAKVIQLFKIDQYQSEMRIIDGSGDIWHSFVYNIKYRCLREGQYVRIRAGSLMHHSKGYEKSFGLRPYSNILTLPYPCKLA